MPNRQKEPAGRAKPAGGRRPPPSPQRRRPADTRPEAGVSKDMQLENDADALLREAVALRATGNSLGARAKVQEMKNQAAFMAERALGESINKSRDNSSAAGYQPPVPGPQALRPAPAREPPAVPAPGPVGYASQAPQPQLTPPPPPPELQQVAPPVPMQPAATPPSAHAPPPDLGHITQLRAAEIIWPSWTPPQPQPYHSQPWESPVPQPQTAPQLQSMTPQPPHMLPQNMTAQLQSMIPQHLMQQHLQQHMPGWGGGSCGSSTSDAAGALGAAFVAALSIEAARLIQTGQVQRARAPSALPFLPLPSVPTDSAWHCAHCRSREPTPPSACTKRYTKRRPRQEHGRARRRSPPCSLGSRVRRCRRRRPARRRFRLRTTPCRVVVSACSGACARPHLACATAPPPSADPPPQRSSATVRRRWRCAATVPPPSVG
jgi:hypothetical protein